jgi:putative transposase
MWNLLPPPGFQGLRDDLPLEVYVRHLPHWRQSGATYFVTFRLADSLPQDKLHELDELRLDWQRRHPPPQSREFIEEFARLTSQRVEGWLDQGMGSCVLKEPSLAAFVTQGLHHFDGERCELDAYVVMPNHVHAIVRPTHYQSHPLEMLLKSWKQFSAKRINAELARRTGFPARHEPSNTGSTGPARASNEGMRRAGKPVPRAKPTALWQEETYDRIIRDCQHLDNCLQYIAANPRKAGLPPGSCPLWIRPEWIALGWTFRE